MEPLLGAAEDNEEEDDLAKVFYDDVFEEPSISSTVQVNKLQREVHVLREEVTQCKLTIQRLQDREKCLKDRLSSQAQKEMKSSHKFEDINLGKNRPTELIRRYGDLYSEARLDAIDALDDLPEIANFEDLKGKLLFSVIVLSFRSVKNSLSKLHGKLKTLLCLDTGENPADSHTEATRKLEEDIASYMCTSHDRYDLSENITEVCSQVYQTLFDFPSLQTCNGLKQYVEDCVRIAWSLSVQTPPFVIKYDSQFYNVDLHKRFHSSDPESHVIKMVMWPPLLDGNDGDCVYKGVVLT